MDIVGSNTIVEGLNASQVAGVAHNVFGAFSGVIIGAIVLTLTVYFIRKILNGANKGKARLR